MTDIVKAAVADFMCPDRSGSVELGGDLWRPQHVRPQIRARAGVWAAGDQAL